MTEGEWLRAVEPTAMLEFLRDKTSDRKLRLFGCACCRHNWDILSRKVRKSLVTAERYADREKTLPDIGIAMLRARMAENVENRRQDTFEGTAIGAVAMICEHPLVLDNLLTAIAMAAGTRQNAIEQIIRLDAEIKQAFQVREIFGNPFRPVTLNSSWLTSTVVALASGIYSEKAFERMPILADALQDAGCDSEDILNHCREAGEHVRGCWVVDLLLGKS